MCQELFKALGKQLLKSRQSPNIYQKVIDK